MSDAPKSSLDLVLERLRKKDAEAGVDQRPLTDEQKTAIAEVRSVYEAKAAERKIMHQSGARIIDPEDREAREVELRRDLERFERERDEKIARIRAGS